MKNIQALLDEVYELPIEDFESFDETYRKYRIEKRREEFIKTYYATTELKKEGKLFSAQNIQELTEWLNG